MNKHKIILWVVAAILIVSSFGLVYVGTRVYDRDHETELGERTVDDALWSVHVLDVGQGDAIFVELPSGMQMLVDGADEQKLVKQMKSEIESMKSRHESQQGAVQGWVDLAPAMGMIGTLIGLVLMLGNMGDPKSIGPAMAVALLTTLYGAFVANVLFMPIVGKLEYYSAYEVVYREMVLEGLRGIARSESPRNIQDQMASALPPKLQSKFEIAA